MRRTRTSRCGGGRSGFTLIEACLAIIIVGVGIFAAMELFAVCTRQNAMATRITVASMLARNLEEVIVHLPLVDPIEGSETFGPEEGEALANFDDVDDFHGFSSASVGVPVDSLLLPIPELAQYEQQVTVTPVLASNLAVETAGSDAVRVDVAVVWRRTPDDTPEPLFVATWYRMR